MAETHKTADMLARLAARIRSDADALDAHAAEIMAGQPVTDEPVIITGRPGQHQMVTLDGVLGDKTYWIVGRTIDVDRDEIRLTLYADKKYQRVWPEEQRP